MTAANPAAAPWYAPWRHDAEPAPALDAADLGTAFGLDISMQPMADIPEAPAPDDAAPGTDSRWVQRPRHR